MAFIMRFIQERELHFSYPKDPYSHKFGHVEFQKPIVLLVILFAIFPQSVSNLGMYNSSKA
jgi:hypothetical protein